VDDGAAFSSGLIARRIGQPEAPGID